MKVDLIKTEGESKKKIIITIFIIMGVVFLAGYIYYPWIVN
jgi:flagellar basal body-associated protein FliL